MMHPQDKPLPFPLIISFPGHSDIINQLSQSVLTLRTSPAVHAVSWFLGTASRRIPSLWHPWLCKMDTFITSKYMLSNDTSHYILKPKIFRFPGIVISNQSTLSNNTLRISLLDAVSCFGNSSRRIMLWQDHRAQQIGSQQNICYQMSKLYERHWLTWSTDLKKIRTCSADLIMFKLNKRPWYKKCLRTNHAYTMNTTIAFVNGVIIIHQ